MPATTLPTAAHCLNEIGATTEDYYSGRATLHEGRWVWNTHLICFGQRGYAGTEHFPTLELAEAAFEKMVAEVEAAYRRSGGFVREDKPGDDRPTGIVRRAEFVNITKAKRRGKVVHTVTLLRTGR